MHRICSEESMKSKLLATSLFLFFSLSNCNDNPASSNETNYLDNLEKEVHRLINLHRTGIGLKPLEWNELIAKECRNHNIDMKNAHNINNDGFNDRINSIKKNNFAELGR